MNQQDIKTRIAETVHGKDPNAIAYLFGSRTRGDVRDDSDWDILILVDDVKVINETEDKFKYGLYDTELEIGQVIFAFILLFFNYIPADYLAFCFYFHNV